MEKNAVKRSLQELVFQKNRLLHHRLHTPELLFGRGASPISERWCYEEIHRTKKGTKRRGCFERKKYFFPVGIIRNLFKYCIL